MTCDESTTVAQPNLMDARKQSTGTLNRLILVAQALESEVDSRQRNDVNGSRIILTIRMANMVLLVSTFKMIKRHLAQVEWFLV